MTYLSPSCSCARHLALLLMAQAGASNGGRIDEETSDCLTSLLLLGLGNLLLSFSTSLSSSIVRY